MLLAGCAATPKVSVVDPAGELRATVDPALKQPLAGPTDPPQRLLSRGEVRSLWNADRSRLRQCVATQAAIVQQLAVTEGGIPAERKAK